MHIPIQYTLITGASSGLGRELAIQCAKRKMNLLLVALPGRNLQSIGLHISKQYGVDVKIVELDLTDAASLFHLKEQVTEYPVNFLINNAGTGGSSDFANTPFAAIDRIIQLNIRATALLTRLMIPVLLTQERSYILNVASISAFSPIAYKTVYPASKAFVYSFSIGLREEFRKTNLSVSAVYPGPILTNADTARRLIEHGSRGKLALLPASVIARVAIEKTLRGKAMIIPGIWNKITYYIMQTVPPLVKSKWLSGIVRKELIVSAK